MSEKLDILYKQYQENRVAVEKQEEANAFLEVRLAEKQDVVLETMKKDLKGFLSYLKDVDFRRRFYLEDVELDFYTSSHGKCPHLIVDFGRGDNVELKCNPSGYSHNPVMFDLNNNSWGWFSDECKKFIAENWGKISSVLEEEIAKALSKAIDSDTQKVNEKQVRLLSSIDKVTENIDVSKRKDVLLYNAISLFIDETWDQYDDKDEWFGMLQNELGASVNELEELGIRITAEGGLEAVDKEKTEAEREVEVQILFSGVGDIHTAGAVENNFCLEEFFYDAFREWKVKPHVLKAENGEFTGEFEVIGVGKIERYCLTDELVNDLLRLTHHAECLYEDTGAEYVHVEVCIDGKWYGREEKETTLENLISDASQRSEEQSVGNCKTDVDKEI